MRILVWLIRLFVFVLLLMVAAYNVQTVTFHFFADMAWEAPLVVLLLVAFVLGVVLTGLVLSVRIFAQHRQVHRLEKQIEQHLLNSSAGRASEDSANR